MLALREPSSLRSPAVSLTAAQQAREIRADLTFEQIIDMINAIAKIPAGPDYLEPMFETLLNGLRPSETRTTIPKRHSRVTPSFCETPEVEAP